MPTPTYAALLPETGYHWGVEPSSGPTAVTFSFMAADPQVYADFRPLTEGERAAARQALAEWSKVADIAFTEVEGDGQIRFAVGNLDGNAIGMTRWWSVSDDAGGAEIVSAEVWVDRSSPLAFEPGGSGLRVLLHEIGHAIGLQHPLENDPENSATEQTTLMAYAGHPDMPGVSAETPMVDDIAAVQSIYGPNLATEAGDSLYRWPDNPTFIQTLYDAGGIDTLDLSNLVRGAVADLRPGSLSSVGSYGAGPARDNLGIATAPSSRTRSAAPIPTPSSATMPPTGCRAAAGPTCSPAAAEPISSCSRRPLTAVTPFSTSPRARTNWYSFPNRSGSRRVACGRLLRRPDGAVRRRQRHRRRLAGRPPGARLRRRRQPLLRCRRRGRRLHPARQPAGRHAAGRRRPAPRHPGGGLRRRLRRRPPNTPPPASPSAAGPTVRNGQSRGR